MPQLAQVLKQEDLARGRAAAGLDLTAYTDIIDTIREGGGVGGQLTLEADEHQRTEKRRMSVAAKEQGFKLVWRKAPERQLRFVLAEPGEPVPGGRPRAQKRGEAPTAMRRGRPRPT